MSDEGQWTSPVWKPAIGRKVKWYFPTLDGGETLCVGQVVRHTSTLFIVQELMSETDDSGKKSWLSLEEQAEKRQRLEQSGLANSTPYASCISLQVKYPRKRGAPHMWGINDRRYTGDFLPVTYYTDED